MNELVAIWFCVLCAITTYKGLTYWAEHVCEPEWHKPGFGVYL